MKLLTLSALAGAAAMGLGEVAQGLPKIAYVLNNTDPFLVANGLQSITVRLEGIAPGETITGFIGTASNPWNISTSSPAGFWNLAGQWGDDGSGNPTFDGATSFYAATAATAPGAPGNMWDSGFLGNPATFGEPAGDLGTTPGGFALSGDGSSETYYIAAWITLNPNGFDPPGANYNFLRLTFPLFVPASVSLVLSMDTPAGVIPLHFSTPFETTGTCCLGSSCIVTTEYPCDSFCGVFIGIAPCSACEPPCPADIDPFDGDNVVNIGDLLWVVELWGVNCVPGYYPSADVNCDCSVGIGDLLEVITAWGDCPK